MHYPDVLGADVPPYVRLNAQRLGMRSVLFAPMIWEARGIGAIWLGRSFAGAFSEKRVALVKSFADQAVIAIQNVRLFNETREALERQTATAEILKVIASSPNDVQPVLNAVAERAGRLCNSPRSGVMLQEGDTLRPVADWSRDEGHVPSLIPPMPIRRTYAIGRGFLERRTVHAEDYAELVRTEYPDGRENQRRTGGRTLVTVPLIREEKAIGMLTLWRRELKPYTQHEIGLLETFADQAVIAIENVRLFNETREALERQTATAEILKVISGSVADTQPVFDVIVQSCERLFQGYVVGINVVGEDGLLHLGAYHGPGRKEFESLFPMPLNRETGAGSAILARQAMHYPDSQDGEDTPEYVRRSSKVTGIRSAVFAPMLLEERGIGAIYVTRNVVGPFSEKQIALLETFADQAVIAIENVRLFKELEARNRDVSDALEQQTASAEILKVISGSPTNVQPVFDAIVNSAARLFSPCNAVIRMRSGDTLERVASAGPGESIRDTDALKQLGTIPFDADRSTSARAIMERRTIEVPDTEAPELGELVREIGRAAGHRSITAVPLMRTGEGIGTIILTHPQPGFMLSEKQLSLLQTFADQAVIAIENVRLFNETKEALERQTATAEILKVIAGSPTDVQPVFDTIARSAVILCGGMYANVFRFDGEQLHWVASHGLDGLGRDMLARKFPMRPDRSQLAGRAMLAKALVHIEDTSTDPDYDPVLAAKWARRMLSAPMLREGNPVGAIVVGWSEPGTTPVVQQELLQTFADQAVIAIENVRLFNETKEALERQTATAEILKVIASSPSDVQPVFDAIVRSAVRLVDGFSTVVTRLVEGKLHLAAFTSISPTGDEGLRGLFPMAVKDTTAIADAVHSRAPTFIADIRTDPRASEQGRDVARTRGYQSIMHAPMLREDAVIGMIHVTRAQAGPFSPHQIGLIEAFANQAVIAIENVRLFNETKEALERQTATAEILKVISSSPTNTQPVFESIVESAARLFPPCNASLMMRDGDQIQLSAATGPAVTNIEATKKLFPIPFDVDKFRAARAIAERRIIEVLDTEGPETSAKGLEMSRTASYRSMAIVPLVREGVGIGVIALMVPQPGFRLTPSQLNLVQTFADQAVIAIENVRLFNETKEALERQTATAEILKVIASSPSDVQPVFETIAASALALCKGMYANVFRYDGEFLHFMATESLTSRDVELMKAKYPMRPDASQASDRVILTKATVRIEDSALDPDYDPGLILSGGWRRMLGVPMLREGMPVGVIVVAWDQPGTILKHHQELLQTFADQAVIAIENVRLFNETKEALERQTATAEILNAISRSQTETKPVFDAIARAALRVFGGQGAGISLVEGHSARIIAMAGDIAADEATRERIMPLDRESAHARAIVDRAIVNIGDTQASDAPRITRKTSQQLGFRAIAVAPIMVQGGAIGAISVSRVNPGAFDPNQISLLRSFADQAVIAIENVRLFKELESRTEALTKSVGQLTALGEVGQAISSTLDLETVLQTIVSHAVKLTGVDAGAIYEYDEQAEAYRLQAAENMAPELVDEVRKTPIRKGDGATGRTAETLEPVQVPDIQDESYQGSRKDNLMRTGYRSVLAVPLLREDHLLGAIQVFRRTPGAFAPEIVELLKTFATQSAMAIQNARLFREIAEKGKQLEVASQHKSNFLASMSHELRTPLNAILGLNEMVLGEVYGEVPADMQPPLAQVQTSGKHLLRLINNVLDLAKIEAGRMELDLSDYSVQDTVASVHSTLQPLAMDKGLEFLAHVPNDLDLAYGDGGRMAQCLMNLAGNSLKFTKAGKVEISAAEKDGLLTYRVTDTGVGIPADKIDSLFTEFKQTDATIASEYGGTGLGLSISKKFVEMHGGRIWVESELGKGSAFIIEVPLRVKTP
jgi:GAF domain-containing protein